LTKTPILLLGGTQQAVQLAKRLHGDNQFDVTYSLAGVTRSPTAVPGKVRVGGFGGVAGLETYLANTGTKYVIDATHPFATTMSIHAAQACGKLSIPRILVERPAWSPSPSDRWIAAKDIADAVTEVDHLNAKAVLLTTGSRDVDIFFAAEGPRLFVRSVEPPSVAPATTFTWIEGRGPFALGEELALLRRYGIDCLVTKNSGGDATAAKLVAARQLRVPVIMIERPSTSISDTATTTQGVVQWLTAQRLLTDLPQ
jgi:precorrin-6A/cobalt-precorrin-6A reductase